MSFDLTGKFISSSFQRLFVNDTDITDGTGSVIDALTFEAPFSASAISTQQYITTTGSAVFDGTSSFSVNEYKAVEMYDHTNSYNAPSGALFVSGGELYFAADDHTGDLDKNYCITTNNVLYTAESGSTFDEVVTTPSCLTFTKMVDVYTNPPLRTNQDITAFVSYSLDITAIRNISDITEAGNLTASVDLTSTTSCTYTEVFEYDFTRTDAAAFCSLVPIGTSFATSSAGVFEVRLISGSEQFVTSSVSGNTSALTAFGSVKMCVVSSSTALTNDPGINVTTESFVSIVSSSIDQTMTARMLISTNPYEMQPYITGSGAALTNFFGDTRTITTDKYYRGFEDVDYELVTMNPGSPTDTLVRTEILPIGTTELDVNFNRCEDTYRDSGLNLECVDV